MATQTQIQYVSDAEGKPVGVIVPIELWREIESERATAYLLASATMRQLFSQMRHAALAAGRRTMKQMLLLVLLLCATAQAGPKLWISPQQRLTEVRELMNRRNWIEALAAAETALQQPETNQLRETRQALHSAAGEAALCAIAPQKAIPHFEALWRELAAMDAPEPWVKGPVANFLARSYAEQGNLAEALKWQPLAGGGSFCGNCNDAFSIANDARSQVWRKAADFGTSEATLAGFLRGEIVATKSPFVPQKMSDDIQRGVVKSEAALLLGESYARQGQHDRARHFLQQAQKSGDYTMRLLAAAHLQNLEALVPSSPHTIKIIRGTQREKGTLGE